MGRHLFTGILLVLVGCAGETDAAAGFSVRLDDDATPEASRIELVGGGVEVTPGPNATIWHPTLEPSVPFRVSAEVTHLDSGLHPHGAGITFGGHDVQTEAQRYTYFLVRSDGKFLIKTRDGGETSEIAPWTLHDAVAVEDDQGVTRNRLRVDVGVETTEFFVNDAVVHAAPTASVHSSGRCGYRLVHDIHVRFGELVIDAVE